MANFTPVFYTSGGVIYFNCDIEGVNFNGNLVQTYLGPTQIVTDERTGEQSDLPGFISQNGYPLRWDLVIDTPSRVGVFGAIAITFPDKPTWIQWKIDGIIDQELETWSPDGLEDELPTAHIAMMSTNVLQKGTHSFELILGGMGVRPDNNSGFIRTVMATPEEL